jgi:hypothetical protein
LLSPVELDDLQSRVPTRSIRAGDYEEEVVAPSFERGRVLLGPVASTIDRVALWNVENTITRYINLAAASSPNLITGSWMREFNDMILEYLSRFRDCNVRAIQESEVLIQDAAERFSQISLDLYRGNGEDHPLAQVIPLRPSNPDSS